MVPPYFNLSKWMLAVQHLPRAHAIIVLLVCLSMLMLGLRSARIYVGLGVAIVAYKGGELLAAQMHVTRWYVAAPAALIASGLAWPRDAFRSLLPTAIIFTSGCLTGTFVAYGLHLANYWVGFATGTAGAVLLVLFAKRFVVALFFAALGTGGTLAALGPVVGASSGLLARGAYLGHPAVFAAAGTLLVVVSLVGQVSLSHEEDL